MSNAKRRARRRRRRSGHTARGPRRQLIDLGDGSTAVLPIGVDARGMTMERLRALPVLYVGAGA